jgi:uncharacterized protein YdeI (YjbR/CyaY-like superfamily)
VADRVMQFRAVLEPLADGLGWVVAWLPFEPAKQWKTMLRLRVTVEVSGQVFRTSLFPGSGRGDKGTSGHFLLVNKAMQQAACAGAGAMVEFAVAPDLEEREAELPDELAALLDDEPGLRKWYHALSEYTRREIGKWVVGVKSDEARMRRAQQMAERLLVTMEGEQELPPVIAAAFRERPKARAGWKKMTEAQRRGELMAVFYYQTPEARAKRVAKLCDGAEKRAGRSCRPPGPSPFLCHSAAKRRHPLLRRSFHPSFVIPQRSEGIRFSLRPTSATPYPIPRAPDSPIRSWKSSAPLPEPHVTPV